MRGGSVHRLLLQGPVSLSTTLVDFEGSMKQGRAESRARSSRMIPHHLKFALCEWVGDSVCCLARGERRRIRTWGFVVAR